MDVTQPAELERLLPSVSWFAAVGAPTEWDASTERFNSWTDWPGPEDPGVQDLALHTQLIRDEVEEMAGDRRVDLDDCWERLHAAALHVAQSGSPLFDPFQDAWHPQTQCVWDAAFVAALLGCHLRLAVPVHPDLLELWGWFQAGHWPAGFASGAALPRQLLVF